MMRLGERIGEVTGIEIRAVLAYTELEKRTGAKRVVNENPEESDYARRIQLNERLKKQRAAEARRRQELWDKQQTEGLRQAKERREQRRAH